MEGLKSNLCGCTLKKIKNMCGVMEQFFLKPVIGHLERIIDGPLKLRTILEAP